ncbi:unnamed protein product [Linum trigynum]|uniref:Uncharacterized protein n=1 Tax=Linum trigynum TaxID=586398 RepID=A0AAV2F1B2_9ROSI
MEEGQFEDGSFVLPSELGEDDVIHRSELGRRCEVGRGLGEEPKGRSGNREKSKRRDELEGSGPLPLIKGNRERSCNEWAVAC